ncbi:MAG: indolepyruvate ferredoxin oxidoreductase, partial [Spirochaetaceae bacterium]|nr:indolepyruvate ferredoxin oxidoreductase [Spirochaetaceae bacterium]
EHPRPAVERSDAAGWTLVPANSREQWRKVVESRPAVLGDEAARRYNIVEHANSDADYAVVTAGIGRNYYLEHVDRLSSRPSHLHIGYHPFDPRLLDSMPKGIKQIIVLEDGYPLVERKLKGMVTNGVKIEGRQTGLLPATGELTPDNVQAALNLGSPPSRAPTLALPGRPPQLCQGCPHADSFVMIRTVLDDQLSSVVTSDIGCYALGGLAPEVVTDSIVCMGASIGMAKGAAEAGHPNVVATIGDSTFLHSGIPGLVDAVEANTPMTLVILDNSIVAMTGGQPSATTSERLEAIVRGVGVSPEHIVTLRPIRTEADENAEILRREMAYRGLSVVIARRGCVKFKPMKEKKAG